MSIVTTLEQSRNNDLSRLKELQAKLIEFYQSSGRRPGTASPVLPACRCKLTRVRASCELVGQATWRTAPTSATCEHASHGRPWGLWRADRAEHGRVNVGRRVGAIRIKQKYSPVSASINDRINDVSTLNRSRFEECLYPRTERCVVGSQKARRERGNARVVGECGTTCENDVLP